MTWQGLKLIQTWTLDADNRPVKNVTSYQSTVNLIDTKKESVSWSMLAKQESEGLFLKLTLVTQQSVTNLGLGAVQAFGVVL